jgi:ligand-binding SRPBCC domain-containing protein
MRFDRESVIRTSPERLFAFHQLPDALQRLTPPWESVRVVEAAPSLEVGQQAIVEIKLLGLLPMRCVSVHTRYDPPRLFEDTMTRGPFRRWVHRHLVTPHPDGAMLRDEVDYELPAGPMGGLLAPLLVVPRLRRLFEYRHQVTRAWCEEA